MLGREEAVVVGQGSVDGKDGDSSLGDVKAPEKITKS